MRPDRAIPGIVILLLALILGGCAGLATTGQKHTAEQDFSVAAAIDLPAAVELAARVFEQQMVIVTGSSPPSGYIAGITYRGRSINRISFTLMVDIRQPGPGMLRVKATSTAGPEVAFTTDLDDIAEDFVRAYGEALAR